MSIRGLGTDIVAVARMRRLCQRHEDRFLKRCFREPELTELRALDAERRVLSLAGRWAAKEAFLKALGGSIADIPYHDIVVLKRSGGGPQLQVAGVAARALRSCEGARLHLTISHEHDFAVATVVIENQPLPSGP